MKSTNNFYDKFHKTSRLQKRIIGKKNFTYRTVVRILSEFIKEEKRLDILDFGCGVGTISFYLASLGNSVTSLDISDNAISLAKVNASIFNFNKGSVNFFCLEKGFEKISKKLFDLIICIEVIEHIKDDKKTLEFLARHLKNNGFLILSVPNKNAPLHRLKLTRKFDEKVGHLRRYEISSLSNLIINSNLKTKRIFITEGILRNSLFVSPVLGKVIKFLIGPLSDLVMVIDDIFLKLFGGSNYFVIAQKK